MAGRPSKLTPELIKKASEYLETCKDETEILGDQKPVVIQNVNLPTVEGLALHLKVSRSTIYEWIKDNQEFSDIVDEILQEQAKRLLNKGLSGAYNPTIAKLILSGKHGYVEKQEVDQTIKGDVKFINDIPRPE